MDLSELFNGLQDLGAGFQYVLAGGPPAWAAIVTLLAGSAVVFFASLFIFRWLRWRWSDFTPWLVVSDPNVPHKTALVHSSTLGQKLSKDTSAIAIRARTRDRLISPRVFAKLDSADRRRVPLEDDDLYRIHLSPDLYSKLGLSEAPAATEGEQVPGLRAVLKIQSRVPPWNSPNEEISISFWTTAWVTLLTTIIAVIIEVIF